MSTYGWLSGIAGASRGASSGLGSLIDVLERAKSEKKTDERYQDEKDYRRTHDQSESDYRREHDALEMLQTGRFRVRNVLDQAALEPDSQRPAVYGDADPNAPTQPAPTRATSASPVHRALSMADLEAIPQSELDAEALKKLDAQEGVRDKHQPWAPKTEQEYIDSRRRDTASGDAVNDESRAALRDQRIARNRSDHVTRAVAGAIGRLQAQGIDNPTPQQVHAAAVNALAADPQARKLFLSGGRASDYNSLRDEVWSGMQTRTDKFTKGKKPAADWTPEGDEAPAATSSSNSGDVTLSDRKTVPDQAAYDELRQKGLSATAIRTRYNLDPTIKRVW